MRISAVLITRNEEDCIEDALRSLQGVADEIVVVDSHSTDRTVRIARKYTDRVVERTWTNYADQKNYANAQARHLWILCLDADEKLSPELRAEIIALKGGPPPDCPGFSMPRRVFYLGRWIRHSGWYPDYRQPQLFRRGKLRYTTDAVHETYELDGRLGRLQEPIAQVPFRDLAQVLHKMPPLFDAWGRTTRAPRPAAFDGGRAGARHRRLCQALRVPRRIPRRLGRLRHRPVELRGHLLPLGQVLRAQGRVRCRAAGAGQPEALAADQCSSA